MHLQNLGARIHTRLILNLFFIFTVLTALIVGYGLYQARANSASAQSTNVAFTDNASDGGAAWADTQLDAFDSSPFVANGLVYLGTKGNAVVAVDAQSGHQKGSFATKAPVNTSPMVANGVIYTGAANGNVYAFHLA